MNRVAIFRSFVAQNLIASHDLCNPNPLSSSLFHLPKVRQAASAENQCDFANIAAETYPFCTK